MDFNRFGMKELSSPEVSESRSLEGLRWRCSNVTLGGPEDPKGSEKRECSDHHMSFICHLGPCHLKTNGAM